VRDDSRECHLHRADKQLTHPARHRHPGHGDVGDGGLVGQHEEVVVDLVVVHQGSRGSCRLCICHLQGAGRFPSAWGGCFAREVPGR